MKIISQNLLSKAFTKRVALIWKLPKIKLRFVNKFSKLVILLLFSLSLLGYYPNLGYPPIKRSVAKATYQQQGEVIANSFSKPLILPHPGYLSTKFSSYHPGIDIAVGLGMPIHPIMDGEVVAAGRDFFGLGNYVEISHEKGFKSKYAHMGNIYVKTGDKITSANLLGDVGLTGRTSGPHTHLEITHDGNYIDPLTILPELPNMPF